jgi:hypothetical protein
MESKNWEQATGFEPGTPQSAASHILLSNGWRQGADAEHICQQARVFSQSLLCVSGGKQLPCPGQRFAYASCYTLTN